MTWSDVIMCCSEVTFLYNNTGVLFDSNVTVVTERGWPLLAVQVDFDGQLEKEK